MTPAEVIADLDAEIAESGDVVFVTKNQQRYQLRGFVRGYKPQEFANGIDQGDTLVVLSPTDAFNVPDLPEAGNKIEIAGRVRRIFNVEPVTMVNVVVRLNLTVRG